MKAVEESESAGVTCCVGWIWCCRGEESGEPLAREDRSDSESTEERYTTNQSLKCEIKSLLETYIFLSEKTRDEVLVVRQIEAASGLELDPPQGARRRLGTHSREFPHTLDTAELTLSVLRRRCARSSP